MIGISIAIIIGNEIFPTEKWSGNYMPENKN